MHDPINMRPSYQCVLRRLIDFANNMRHPNTPEDNNRVASLCREWTETNVSAFDIIGRLLYILLSCH
jgi:hypothetical protein